MFEPNLQRIPTLFNPDPGSTIVPDSHIGDGVGTTIHVLDDVLDVILDAMDLSEVLESGDREGALGLDDEDELVGGVTMVRGCVRVDRDTARLMGALPRELRVLDLMLWTEPCTNGVDVNGAFVRLVFFAFLDGRFVIYFLDE